MTTAWSTYANRLAKWTEDHLVNRTDAHGRYRLRDRDGSKSFTDKQLLTIEMLAAHYRGRRRDDLVGLHSIAKNETCKYLALDVDQHDDDDGGTAKLNLRAALAWFDKLHGLGFRPLLLDSNGKGGFHLLVLFAKPVPSELTFRFAQWITHDFDAMGLSERPETFPKQKNLEGIKYGNWLRLPGKHHSHNHWSRVWSDNDWLAGEEAIRAILTTTGDSPD